MNIGVDLGGTKIKVGIASEGLILEQNTALLLQKDSLSSTLKQIKDLIRPHVSKNIDQIGIGVPSVVDTERGIVYNVTNIPSWEKVALKDILEEEFHLPTFVNNDVNCFTLGEHLFGQAKGYNTAVGLTLGTGLGAGIIIDNKLYKGFNTGAGEIGLLKYLEKNYEYYLGSSFFERNFGFNAREVFIASQDGNKWALDAYAEFGMHLGAAIQAVMYTYDPEVVVLGGSISHAFSFFENTMHEGLKDFEFPESLKNIKILKSNNENIALLGAAALSR
ncbi:ROK family protein [Arcticibacterium luteifluviistationis]|uniref:Sugar kinase n=1 Tax=Arcticibacterium luteifluviistationis TaxID=1784714 RepID=A0A2Z4GBK5_9BACT|nr:ROK family protein [Arcticibacterium luteifluviistationis]AWV98514.1 sugar kinase [Arcticibacterium luteifluviistationis]